MALKHFERKIGEVFTYERGNKSQPLPIHLVVKEVAETSVSPCSGCYFRRAQKTNINPYGCTKIYAFVGDCADECRRDKKNVIFAQINEKAY